MIELVDVARGLSLDDYASNANLRTAVDELRAEAAALVPRLEGRTVWMVNSTARGGGVAEMLPPLVSMLRELGVSTCWAVIKPEQAARFFSLTKRLHNLVHDSGDPDLGPEDRELYESTSRRLSEELAGYVSPKDVVVVHDPQPAGVGALLADKLDVLCVWRCHIGLDRRTPRTAAAWHFLEPSVSRYHHAVFSAAQYIPHYLAGRASVIHPAIDPLSHKNRELSPIKLTGILCNAGLVEESSPVVTPAWSKGARRLRRDGTFGPATDGGPVGLLFRPMVTQISRWDRLKGWAPLLEGFAELKRRAAEGELSLDDRQRRRLQIARLILAGPEPGAVQDDPEAMDVLGELKSAYAALEPGLAEDVVLLSLPMDSLKHNALMVNVLQRAASVVVQNSLQEGFGLVVAEAMWKRTPVLASATTGIRQQLRDGVDGRLIPAPDDPRCVAEMLHQMLADPNRRAQLARNAQRRVHDDFLIFRQVRSYLSTLSSCLLHHEVQPRSS